jgi:heme-degrading monooxygenase HmoA
MGEQRTTFMAAVTCELAANDFDRVSQEAAQFAERRARLIPGFIEAAVLGSEDKTRLLIVSHWDSKSAWADAQWDNEVGHVVADLAKSASSFDVQTFLPVAIVRKES